MNRLARLTTSSVLITAAFLLALASGQGQQAQQQQAALPEIKQSIQHDVSLPLRDIARPPQPRLTREAEPVRRLPVQLPITEQQDAAVQTIVGPLVGTIPGLS